MIDKTTTLGLGDVKAIRDCSEQLKVALWSPVRLVEKADGVYDLEATRYTLNGRLGWYYQRNSELDTVLGGDIASLRLNARLLREMTDDLTDVWILCASQRGVDKLMALAAIEDDEVVLDCDPAPPFEFALRSRFRDDQS